jgi:mannose-6-phosphate isomerase
MDQTLYPLKFKPVFKNNIWGGQQIKKYFKSLQNDLPTCGEAWVLSGIEDSESIVTNGFLKDNALNELAEIYMEDLLGEKVFETYGSEFPLLFKIIDANDFLSIQVHPNDEMALKAHGCLGKTEMWYILHAEPDATLISGFNREINQKEFLEHLKNKTLPEILNYETVKSGDVFYIPAGRIHAIGPGITLAEIQQSSDITYRLYDWDRMTIDGTYRELHLENGLKAIDYNEWGSNKISVTENHQQKSTLVSTDLFTANLLHIHSKICIENPTMETFSAYLCVEGNCRVACDEMLVEVCPGEAILIPASVEEFEIIPEGHCNLIETYIGNVASPKAK